MESQSSRKPTRPPKGKIPRERYDEILMRIHNGEKQKDLAAELGVSAEAISQLKQRLTRQQGELRHSLRHRKRLTQEELHQLRQLTSTTSPKDHQLATLGNAPSWRWTNDRIRALALQTIGKAPALNVLNDIRNHHSLTPPPHDPYARPEPPAPHSIDQIPPELAEDPDYVRYYLSPLAYEIAQRSYQLRLADWERRQNETSAPSSATTTLSPPSRSLPPSSTSPPPRTGKHSKGSTPRRKKRRR